MSIIIRSVTNLRSFPIQLQIPSLQSDIPPVFVAPSATYDILTVGTEDILLAMQTQLNNLVASGTVSVAATLDTSEFDDGYVGGGGAVSPGVANQLSYYATDGNSLSPLTAIIGSKALVSNSSGLPVASTTTSTELGYVHGVTSAIQPQLDGKQPSGTYIASLTGDLTATGPGVATATLTSTSVTPGSYINASITVDAKGRITAASSGSDVVVPGSTDGAVQFNSSGSFAGDASNLFWDNTNKILGIGTSTPDTSSVLDVSSTTKGVLFPRLTTLQRDSISSPASGLVIYNTNTNLLNVYNGLGWIEAGFASPLSVSNGGTGQSSFTDGQLLIGDSVSGGLDKATLSGTVNQIIVTNGHGNIVLSTPQNINTTSSPTFNSLTLTNPLMVANGGTNSSTALSSGFVIVSSSGKIVEANGSDYSMNNGKIINVKDPTNPQDAATKNYVDTSAVTSSRTIVTTAPLSGGGDLSANRTLSIPAATNSVDGYLTAADHATFASKQSALSVGNLTDMGVDGIVISGGTGAVIGSGVSISQHVSDSTHSGYLSSTDWNTFNSKQGALTFGNISTSTSGVTITNGANSTVGPNVIVNVQNADSSHTGLLLSSDWNTFNSKQNSGSYITALTGDVTASGPGSTTATLSSTAAVKSIRADSSVNLTGNVQLVSGTNVTLSQVGQAITVNVASGSLFPSKVANVALMSQTSQIGTTTLFTPPTTGTYRVSIYIVDTAAGSAGTVSATIGWTDDEQAQTITTPTVALATLGAFANSTFFIEATNAAPITYRTNFIGALGSPQYSLYVIAERLS